MTCRELMNLLIDLEEGEVTAADLRRFEAHLAGCDDCKSYVDAYLETRRLLRDVTNGEPPSEIPEDLVRSILASRKKGSD